ncbi:EamA family transporter [Paenibacillus radicis (ex Xue et al. 2023)]|uniref:DMT family transporter n=1 Tax=Paenibacillus radicis (ex Xue et al. 2023) TaxID=2972489 RepID=A0ABT1YEX4_9BACL|nr:DMT family transporter [Paenibacillus radicis (ex Xue et al. 2023)]MCR8631467.1 DMT family transporter [Paenibacillus radicis (ex Xue et al. 2023)]
MTSMKRWKAVWLVLLGAASYGILSTLVKLGYQNGFTPAEITGSQNLFGFIMLWLICLPQLRKMKGITFGTVLKLMFSGAFTGLTGYFYYLSLQVLDASFAVLLLFQFTWMGMLLGWLLDKKAPNRFQWLAMIFVLIGTLLSSGVLSGSWEGVHLGGVVLGLLAAVCYTLFICFSGRVATQFPPLVRSTWVVSGAMTIVLILMPPQFLWNGSLDKGLWFWACLMSLFGLILPSYFLAKGAPFIETGLASVLGAVELPVVIVCSALLLQERQGPLQWMGIIIIIIGIFVSEKKTGGSLAKVSVNPKG